MDTLAVIIIACLVTIVILVLIVRNTILSNKITDTTVEYDRLKRENDSLEKECKELSDALNKTTYQNH
jgi:cell division protein FtsB